MTVATLTFDVFSALTDSRSGGAAHLAAHAARRGWPRSGEEIYDRWDALNKELHRTIGSWMSFADLSAHAMGAALAELRLPTAEAPRVSEELLESMVDWPLWPDVTAGSLRTLGRWRLGLLTNMDDHLLAGTAVMRLGSFESDLVVTSQRVQAYKPAALMYGRAAELLGPFVHVASSARDVRGALSAKVRCIRLARPGHALDPAGPAPRWTVTVIASLPEAITLAAESQSHEPRAPSSPGRSIE